MTVAYYDPILQLNTTNDTLPNTFFHELSHKYGTEDNESEGKLFDANQWDYLYDWGIPSWPHYQDLLKSCDPSLAAPGKKKGKQ